MPKKKTTPAKKKKSPPPKISFRTKFMIVCGAVFLGIFLYWHLAINQTIQLAFFAPPVTPVEKTMSAPTHISVERTQLSLPIEQTAINRGVWQVAANGASHLSISARPGEKGPIIMYGHNTDERFGPIRWLSQGDTIVITTADKRKHTYRITETMRVAPNRLDILTKPQDETLILYTCDGFADLERFVVIAKPIKRK